MRDFNTKKIGREKIPTQYLGFIYEKKN